jgi:hypothetical protein
MKYFYLHPYKPQYFFPEGFERHHVFLSFFKPYTIKGAISWFLFRKFRLYRNFYEIKSIEEFIPVKNITKIISSPYSIAFNSGSVGPEQKITGLGFQSNGGYFFLKYAQSTLGRKNVINEHYILKNLQSLDFVPKIQSFYKDDTEVLLKTDVLSGNRLGNVPLNQIILNCLIKLSQLTVIPKHETESKIKSVFAHGDFCPWNMMEKNNEILLFDWEMGGNYPVGYDLFTYIFQTNFLLNPIKPISEILSENKNNIKFYFDHFQIHNWKMYLLNFALLKIGLETKKEKHSKAFIYEKLLIFCKNQ